MSTQDAQDSDGVQMYTPTLDAAHPRESDLQIAGQEEDEPCCTAIVLPRAARPARPARSARKCQCDCTTVDCAVLWSLVLCSIGVGLIVAGMVSQAGPIRRCRANQINQAVPTNVTSTSDGSITYTTGSHHCKIIVFTPPTVHVGDEFHVWWSPNRAHCALEEKDDHCDVARFVMLMVGGWVVLAGCFWLCYTL
jgi:hypothetical protein